MKMAMKNNLNTSIKSSSYKQVKRPNGKYGQISLYNNISKCDICGNNFQTMKLFDHIKESHCQYFCIVCRARFIKHKDLISHLQDIHQLVASEYINKAQDVFSECVNKRYFARPISTSRLPIPPTSTSQLSQSSSEDDELLLDNLDVLDVVLGCKMSENTIEEIVINEIINSIINEAVKDELFEHTLQETSCSDISIADETGTKNLLSKNIQDINQIQLKPVVTKNTHIINNNSTVNMTYNNTEQNHITGHIKTSQSLNVDEEFKLGIKSMNTVLSEKSPWVNGSDILHSNEVSKNCHDELPVMALTLDQKLYDMNVNLILKECIRTSCLTCIYCHNSTCVAVNAKQLALHMIKHHRFMTVKNESSQDVVKILKSKLNELENIYFNSESFDSTDESCHIPFNNIFYCFNCQFTSQQMKEVNSHKRSIHSRKTFDCTMCKITFSNYGELHCHLCPGTDLGNWKNLSFRCLFCGKGQIPSAFRCMVHLRKAHNACDYCLDTFPNQQTLALHVNKHKMRHMCLKCNITYLSKKDIFEHMFWKHNRDSKECKLCLTKKWPYTYHFCVPPATFTCEECKRTFSNALLLKVHQRWHSGNIPYECDLCHSKFITKKLLVKHEIIHKKVTSPTKKKKKKKKGDNYNLPPLNLSSDSETEKTPRYKSDKFAKSPSPSVNNYWDYVSKQKKELVHIALLDHDYTLVSPSQTEKPKSPLCQDEINTPIYNGNENILNNSFNNSSCKRSSCTSHCESSTSSSSCGSNCSCSSSCSSSCESHTENKNDIVIESPKKHKKKKKVKKVKILSIKKIANFNLGAAESDLESEFSNTDNEDYYDINPVSLRPEISKLLIDGSQQINPEVKNYQDPLQIQNEFLPQISISENNILKISKKTQQYSVVSKSQKLQNNEQSDCFHFKEQENHSTSIDSLPSFYNNEVAHTTDTNIKNDLNKTSAEICNGRSVIYDVHEDLSIILDNNYEIQNSHILSHSNKNKSIESSSLKKKYTKRQTKPKFIPNSKNSSQILKAMPYTSSPLSVNSSIYSTNTINTTNCSLSPNDTRQSKRQPKKRKFFGYDSSDEEIANGDSFKIQINPQKTPPPQKKKVKKKLKSELSYLVQNTPKLSTSQQSRPIVDVRLSKNNLPPVSNESDSDDSGNLIIELPKFVEQKAVQSTERLYCHCRCPYDEVSEMIACDNPNCRVEWFHFDCVGITVAPKGNWYCPDCR
ncbi:uncharacterized protein LOC126901180 [Daktulosphaira vitifoliae]|uniref:uncharacterized protein LOC126901180 n=1 Tax=Daktulosphaira vitifoliae TaxID=58002 RepID=UPI0021AA782F|nr:uncharacterized protein LOC126901180 [Daktulosphaira vitifoliae]XP_050533451.1 uncharacterized protein LOC126901180 [Daktulosphaira vitifoliae]XP_050533452.1 uncharacterized protein LOC126901180 [Daktulosphaira vitifoliae]XP_050533453.1 uncharacterized protein LOC126901180 [Daktulosphaira vitifoliae]